MMGESLRKKPKIGLGAAHGLVVAQLLTAPLLRLLVAQQLRRVAPLANALVVVSVLMSAGPALAQPTQLAQPTAQRETVEPVERTPLAANADGEAALDERAQRHWGSGMAYLDEDNYAKALEAFEKAYELSGRPRILLAIAVTHERRGDLGQAIATLDEYLRLAPTADNSASIRAHRDELQAQHDEQVQSMNDAKKDEVKTTRADESVARATPEKQTGSVGLPPRDTGAEDPATWRWTAFGVGVASGVAATVSGLLAWKKYDELERGCGGAGYCTDQETQTGRTMAVVSTVLTGVSVLGLGVGLWLSFDGPESSEPTQPVHVGVAYRPSGLTSEVSWSF